MKYWLYFLLIFFNSGILFLHPNNRTGIPFTREAFIALLVVTFIWLLFVHTHWFSRFVVNTKLALYILFIFILPSVFALVKFGQPVIYGLLEERRTLMFLIFFPVFYGLCVKDISIDDVTKFIKISALLCIFLSCLYLSGFIAENTNADVSFSTIEEIGAISNSDIREATRLPIGTEYVLFSILMIMFKAASATITRFDGMFMIAAMGFFFFIQQSRGTMSIIIATAIFLLLTHKKFRVNLLLPLTVITFILVSLAMTTDVLQEQIEKVDILTENLTEPIETRVRYLTSVTIISELKDNYFMGMGSLSRQWNLGFEHYFGKSFYITDVGTIGLFYRFGVLSILVLFAYYHLFWSGLKENNSYELRGVSWVYIITGLLYFYADLNILWGGGTIGMLWAFIYYEKYFLSDEEVLMR